MTGQLPYYARRVIKVVSRRAERLLARHARLFGVDEPLRRLQRRLHVALDNAALPERVRRGDVMFERRARRMVDLEDTYRRAFADCHDGDYLEFGVYYGNSMVCAWRAVDSLGLRGVRLLGFDSFEGMPASSESEAGPWIEGQFRSDLAFTRRQLADQGVDLTRTELIKGWFSDTLNDSTREALGLRRASVIMVDCDVYSAASQALAWCEPLIGDSAILLFDDWDAPGVGEDGERRAFREWLAAHPRLSAQQVGSYSPTSAVFQVVRSDP